MRMRAIFSVGWASAGSGAASSARLPKKARRFIKAGGILPRRGAGAAPP